MDVRCYYIAQGLVIAGFGYSFSRLNSRIQVIDRVGRPASIEDLNHLPVTGLVDRNTGKLWPWVFSIDRQWMPSITRFRSADAEAELMGVQNGLGFAQIPDFLAQDLLRQEKLVRVLEEAEPVPWDLFIYRPQRGPVPQRVRLVFDHLVTRFSVR
jgi:DNA-binding transcriptional LysR family regulator